MTALQLPFRFQSLLFRGPLQEITGNGVFRPLRSESLSTMLKSLRKLSLYCLVSKTTKDLNSLLVGLVTLSAFFMMSHHAFAETPQQPDQQFCQTSSLAINQANRLIQIPASEMTQTTKVIAAQRFQGACAPLIRATRGDEIWFDAPLGAIVGAGEYIQQLGEEPTSRAILVEATQVSQRDVPNNHRRSFVSGFRFPGSLIWINRHRRTWSIATVIGQADSVRLLVSNRELFGVSNFIDTHGTMTISVLQKQSDHSIVWLKLRWIPPKQ
jgi:hypothetical protein